MYKKHGGYFFKSVKFRNFENVIPKSLTILGYRFFVNGFFKKFPQHKEFKTWSPKPFTNLIHEFHKDFIQAVIDNREGADLPLKLGNIKIIAYKTNKTYPNFKNFIHKNNPISGFTNNHTNGLNCKLSFNNLPASYRLKDKLIWGFKPEVNFKKRISEAFVANHMNYSYSPNTVSLKYEIKNINLKHNNDKKIKEFLKTYDEFYIR